MSVDIIGMVSSWGASEDISQWRHAIIIILAVVTEPKVSFNKPDSLLNRQ